MNKPYYIKELDGLRAFAILLVIIWHYVLGQTTQEMLPNYLWLVLSWSWSGVDLFFVLSGFLIGRILLYYKESPNYFKTFYLRRVFRIFPVYYLLLVLYVGAKAIGLSSQFPVLLNNPLPDLPYFLYLQNFFMAHTFGANALAVTWSLAIEEQFYLLFPLLLFYLPQKQLPKLFIGGIIIAPIIRGILGGYFSYVLLPARMDALLMGALIAYYHSNGTIDKVLSAHKKFLGWATLLVFGVLMVLVFEGSAKNTGAILNHSLYAVLYGLIIINVLVQQNTSAFFSKLLANPVLRFIGKVSYSIYLFHEVFLLLLTKLINNKDLPWIESKSDVWITFLAFACTLAFSALLYFALEKPMQKIGKRYQY